MRKKMGLISLIRMIKNRPASIKSDKETIDYSLSELMGIMEDKSQNILSTVNSLKEIIGEINDE
jgi:hypothetical protein